MQLTTELHGENTELHGVVISIFILFVKNLLRETLLNSV
jgi:hypothetical protein